MMNNQKRKKKKETWRYVIASNVTFSFGTCVDGGNIMLFLLSIRQSWVAECDSAGYLLLAMCASRLCACLWRVSDGECRERMTCIFNATKKSASIGMTPKYSRVTVL